MPFADPTLVVLSAASAVYLLALGIFARAGNSRQRAAPWLMAAYAACVLGWAACTILTRLQGLGMVRGFDLAALARIAAYLILAQALLFAQLTRLFQTRATSLERTPVLRAAWIWAAASLFWLLAAVVLYENVLRLPALYFPWNGQRYIFDPALTWLLLGWGASMIASAALTMREYRLSHSPLHRNRNKYWTAALGMALAGHAAALVLTPNLHAAAGALQMLAALAAVYALFTYSLPDLRALARGAASYVVLTLSHALLYLLAFAALAAVLRFDPGPARQQWITAAVFLALGLAVLMRPLSAALARGVRRLFSGAGYDSRRALAEYSASISNILDLDVLATIVIGLISEAMEISRGALIVVQAERPGGDLEPGAQSVFLPEQPAAYLLRPITGMGDDLPETRIPADSPAALYLCCDRRPLAQYDLDLHPRFNHLLPEERAWWSSLKMDMFVPVYVKDQWIGLLALGPKASGDRYFDEDLAFLQTLADQTAVSFENARLFDNLKQRNAENEQLNAELTAANVELARLDQAKSNFINIASHELRTPLTQIMGFNGILAEMVQNAPDLPDAPLITASVRKAAQRLEEIVDTMFDVSKLDTRTLDLHLGPVRLSTLAESAVDVWRAGLEERSVRLTVRGLDSLPVIQADEKRLIQVFANLIQNAIRSTPDGGLIIISGHAVEPDGADASAWVEVVVADTGIGIDGEHLERIFDKFYRVGNVLLHSTGETKFRGAGPGLGLTIARGIVEAHGGRIWAESPGYDETACPGARFHVLLPGAAAQQEVAAVELPAAAVNLPAAVKLPEELPAVAAARRAAAALPTQPIQRKVDPAP